MYNDAKDMPNLLKNNQELMDMTDKLVKDNRSTVSRWFSAINPFYK